VGWIRKKRKTEGHLLYDLGPDAEMGVGDELGSLVLSMTRLQEDIQHAHTHARERYEVGESLPHAS